MIFSLVSMKLSSIKGTLNIANRHLRYACMHCISVILTTLRASRERYFSPQLGTLLVLVINLENLKALFNLFNFIYNKLLFLTNIEVSQTCGYKGCLQKGAPCAQCPRTEHGGQRGLDTSGRLPPPPKKPQIGQTGLYY